MEYKPSNTVVLDLIRTMGICEVSTIHALSIDEVTDNIRQCIDNWTYIRRTIATVIANMFPDYSHFNSCITNKHNPSLIILSMEASISVDEKYRETFHDINRRLLENQALLIEECYGAKLPTKGCLECLADVMPPKVEEVIYKASNGSIKPVDSISNPYDENTLEGMIYNTLSSKFSSVSFRIEVRECEEEDGMGSILISFKRPGNNRSIELKVSVIVNELLTSLGLELMFHVEVTEL